MRATIRFLTATGISLIVASCAVFAVVACGGGGGAGGDSGSPGGDSGSPTGPAVTGSVRVTTVTTGQNLDPDGYTVAVGSKTGVDYTVAAGSKTADVGINGAVTLTGLSAGYLAIELRGVASSCFVSATNPGLVTVFAGQTTDVTYPVACSIPGADRIAFNTERDGNSEIYLMNSDGTGLVNLTENSAFDANPAWSPDGSKIAFTSRRDGNLEIYVMNADGTGLVNLTQSSRNEQMPAWSPDGTKIAFVAAVGLSFALDIVVMNADGSNPVDISNAPDFVQRPAWSPDGSRMAWGTDRDLNVSPFTEFAFEIYSFKADGSDPRNLTNHDTAEDDFPAWSPDGTRIAFHSNRSANLFNDYDIFTMKSDGSGVVNLSQNEGAGDFLPAWSPSGSRIAFESRRGGNSDVYVMNADGSGVVRITNHPRIDSFAAWKPIK